MNFDVDLEKSIVNKLRHGIDFFEVQALWGAPALEIRLSNSGTPMHMVIGIADTKYWAALITYDDGYIQPLIVRPAREEEIALYEENAF